MSIELRPNLKLAYEQIVEKCNSEEFHHRFEFIGLLKSLNAFERSFCAKLFVKTEWNIGSLQVLAILQDLRILTATEFILSLDDVEKSQLILNDFLEDKFELLTNLFISSQYDSSNSIQINSLLEDCLKGLFKDLLTNPQLNDLKYLKYVIEIMPTTTWLKLGQKHLQMVLDLHSSGLKEAFGNFQNWINEGVDVLRLNKDLHSKLLCHVEQDGLNYMFHTSQQESFRQWKFYLIMLQTIACNCASESSGFIRKYIKSRFRQIITAPSKASLMHLLLTARAATATTQDFDKNLNAYADWYKQTIGEMKFVLKTEEFKIVMELLEQCLSHEMETEYLEIHAITSISPPIMCGKLVQGYKSKCKFRLSQIKSGNLNSEPNESIVIEEDSN